jgi:hypothetical protein
MPVVSLIDTKKIFFAVFCCALLMLFVAPAWAQDPCTPAKPADEGGSACGVLITITGTTGNLTATLTGSGTVNGNPYDGVGGDDELIGIQNSTGAVTIGAIRLSAPPITPSVPFTSNLFAFDGDGACTFFELANCGPTGYEGPNNTFVGISPDQTTGTIFFTTPILPGGSTWFSLEGTPAAVVSIGETQPMAQGVTNVFPFGPFVCTTLSEEEPDCNPGNGAWTEQVYGDDFQAEPLTHLQDVDQWTVLAIPLPAGPLGIGDGGAFGFGPGQYGIETPGALPYGPPRFNSPNFSNLACIAYTDYSKAAFLQSGSTQPTCVEIERDCIESGGANDCGTASWTGQLDYDIDKDSIPGVIGGPHVLWDSNPDHGPTSPTSPPNTDFLSDSLYAYTGATPVLEASLAPFHDPPPPKTSGKPAHSIFVSAFSPTQSETQPIAAGKTVGFPGFEEPIVNNKPPSCSPSTPVNCILDYVPVGLSWDQTDTSGNAINNLHLCLNVSGGVCTTKGVTTPWVYLSSLPVTGCPAGFSGQNPLLGILLNLSTPKHPGEYTFVWEPGSEQDGCEVSVVLEFGTGLYSAPTLSWAAPATFQYTDHIFLGEL